MAAAAAAAAGAVQVQAQGQEPVVVEEVVTFGNCSSAAIQGPTSSEAMLSAATRNNVASWSVLRCPSSANPVLCERNSEVMCAVVTSSTATAPVYLNSHSFVHVYESSFKSAGVLATGTEGFQSPSAGVDISAGGNPLWECFDNDDCRGFLANDGTLVSGSVDCAGASGSCWSQMDHSVIDLSTFSNLDANNSDVEVEYYEVAQTNYFKLEDGVDALDGDTSGCETYDFRQNGMEAIQNECDSSASCTGFSVAVAPNQGMFACLVDNDMTQFKPHKTTRFSTRLFMRLPSAGASSSIKRFYGYAEFPAGTKPASTSIQEFPASSDYSATDCASMCDSLPECTGYSVVNSRCNNIVRATNREVVDSSDSGAFFRKRLTATDDLSACEDGTGECPATLPIGAIVGGIFGGAALLAGAVFLSKKRRNSAYVDDPIEGKLRVGSFSSDVSSRISKTIDP